MVRDWCRSMLLIWVLSVGLRGVMCRVMLVVFFNVFGCVKVSVCVAGCVGSVLG